MNDICCYILYSEKLKKFYIGACQNSLVERIEKHNSKKYGNHRFTSAASDWTLFIRIDCINYSQARAIESKIKSMKSSTFIRNLAQYPEMIAKLKAI